VRLVTYRTEHDPRVGALVDDLILDIDRAVEFARLSPLPRTMRELLALGNAGLTPIRAAIVAVEAGGRSPGLSRGFYVPVSEVTLECPVPDPTKIICVGRNYADHALEIGAARPDRAIFFTRFPQTLVAPLGPVWLPKASTQLDWEGELAIVIGKTARHVSAADAYSVVAGYSIFNDVSVRDFQLRTSQYTAGKNFNATAPFGPSIVTVDEIADPHDLTIETLVNGERVQYGNTSDMLFSIPELIADITEWTTIQAGDVIATGTPAGVGGLRNPPRFLSADDVLTTRISRIGEISNRVIAEPD
jgi:2-keto-4-pentenoate hydratase/2-oxohepta-3-ene-1,7-dioic acid hydratase in catechol pathway